MKTIYNLTQKECVILANKYTTENLALLLYNNNKASSLERAIFKAKKIKKLAKEN